MADLGISIQPDRFLNYTVRIRTSNGVELDSGTRFMLSDAYFTAVVRGSKIISSNTHVSNDNKSAYIRIPMVNYLVAEKGKYSMVVEAEGKPR